MFSSEAVTLHHLPTHSHIQNILTFMCLSLQLKNSDVESDQNQDKSLTSTHCIFSTNLHAVMEFNVSDLLASPVSILRNRASVHCVKFLTSKHF